MKFMVNESVLESVTVNVEPLKVNVPVKVPGKAKAVVPNAPLIWESVELLTGTVMTPVPLKSGTSTVPVNEWPFSETVMVRWKSVAWLVALAAGAVNAKLRAASIATVRRIGLNLFLSGAPGRTPNKF
jgi:hypothetical protein